MALTLDSLPGLELILPSIMDSLDIKSVCQLRLTCPRFARIVGRGGSVYRNCVLEDIIINFKLITKKLDPRGGYWPMGQINKFSLEDQPLDHLEVFCNISRGILKQETQQYISSQNLVHNGSVFLYFFNGIMDPTERLVNLFHLTLYVHSENQTILHCVSGNNAGNYTLNYALECVAEAKYFLGPQKVQRLIQQRNQKGNTILHVFAKKGDVLAVHSILSAMCYEEYFHTNRSGETPLEVAWQAGHYEPISYVYENFGIRLDKAKVFGLPLTWVSNGSPKKRRYY